jgi:hypothetical protein
MIAMTRPLTKTEIARLAKSIVARSAIFTVVMSQPAPITTALVFALVCCFKFIQTVLAISLTVAPHTK